MCKLANITSGECLNSSLKTKDSLFAPFNEAMVEGTTHSFCFTQKFLADRAKTFGVSQSDYLSKMSEFLDLSKNCNDYDTIRLHFGKDMFCQINLLTVLSYLEARGYIGQLIVNIVDELNACPIYPPIDIQLRGYIDIYQSIIVEKTMPSNVGIIDRYAISCYLDYKSNDSKIDEFIKNNLHFTKEELFLAVSTKFEDYGLGYEQVIALIDKTKKYN